MPVVPRARVLRTIGFAGISGCVWIACMDIAALQSGASVDTVDAFVAASTDAIAVGDIVVDAVDPIDAADAFEASGPSPPPTCTTSDAGVFECVAVAPNGWSGPFTLYEGSIPDAPACGPVTQVVSAYAGLVPAAAAQCPACQCNAATETGCANIALEGRNPACAEGAAGPSIVANVCTHFPVGTINSTANQAAAVVFGTSAVVGGSCAPSFPKPTPTKSNIEWSATAVGCFSQVPSTPGCATNQVCVAAAQPPFNAKQCIAKDGDVAACPGAPYSKKSLYYKDAADTRDCAGCACDPPNAAMCTVTGTTSNNPACSPANFSGPPGACVLRDDGTGGTYFYTKAIAVAPTVTCPPKGGNPIGTVTAQTPITICCAQ